MPTTDEQYEMQFPSPDKPEALYELGVDAWVIRDGVVSYPVGATVTPDTAAIDAKVIALMVIWDADKTTYMAKVATQEAKLAGVLFEGVMCSATSEDQHGLSDVKGDVAAGMNVNFHFDNGNTLVLTQANIAAFEATWKTFRVSFFPLP